jgi:hypothetical protein
VRIASREIFNILTKSLLQFEVRPRHYIDCLEFGRVPPVEKITEYEWEMTKLVPPVGSRWMMHLFDCPHDASDDISCVQRFPKKLRGMLEFSRGGENKGWGIYFEEDLVVFSRFPALVSMTGVVASLVFGVYWNITQQDIQGAWGVASWITSVVPLILFAWHSWIVGTRG